MTTLGFIGAGNMGTAILKGFSSSEAAKEVSISVYDISIGKRKTLKQSGFSVYNDEIEIAKQCKYIILACKPQQLPELLEKIKSCISSETVLISLCAGISVEIIRKYTGENTKVILVMPNMPILLGEGASAVACDEKVSNEEFMFVRSIIESCGIAETIPLDKMNEIICINASSPAFIYLFAKGFADYAEEHGINGKAALDLFSQTLIGAGKMLMSSDKSIDELIAQVASKGGTTFAGLEAFHSGGLENIVKNACEACTKRAYELGS
ncbi:MAG: pyrroline-5-carboxylate reductase [Oscillospiraceae bacterium]|nr:pyrroline-5-carboxylate reductase [Oscillospiraceae bacterium]